MLTGGDIRHLLRPEHFRKYSTYLRVLLRFSEVSEHQDLGTSHPPLALGSGLKVLFGLVPVTKKKETATDVGTECSTVANHGTVGAEEATTDHAGLQLQLFNRLIASRTSLIVLLLCLCHICEYIPDWPPEGRRLTWMSDRSYSAPSGGVAQRQSRGLISPVSVVQVYPPPPIWPRGTRSSARPNWFR